MGRILGGERQPQLNVARWTVEFSGRVRVRILPTYLETFSFGELRINSLQMIADPPAATKSGVFTEYEWDEPLRNYPSLSEYVRV